MDKFEYKVRAEEIKALIAQGDYAQAADIADAVDWRRVKSVMMLCTISDLYKINRRFEDARDMLLLAYDRHPGGRTIVYSLCELSIKMEEFVPAVEYYKEFVQIAPKDTGRYILQYKLYEAQDVSLEERIAVLEELKKRDYREKWAYELAYLYHRVGLSTRCVEECDELILWFGEGKYVIKAMELKMLHQPLTPQQQRKYDSRFVPETEYQEYQDEEIYDGYSEEQQETSYVPPMSYVPPVSYGQQEPVQEELDIQVKTMDVSQYNTINLQKELAEGLKEVLGEKNSDIGDPVTRSIVAPMMESDTETLDFPQIEEVDEDSLEPEEVGSEVFFSETGEIGAVLEEEPGRIQDDVPEEMEHADYPADEEVRIPVQKVIAWDRRNRGSKMKDDTAQLVMDQMRQETAPESAGQSGSLEETAEVKTDVPASEPDGQGSLAVPETEQIEKQITGQLSIEDILAEWEQLKKDNEEKRKEEVRQKVMEHTGPIFSEFEASVRDGLLEELEERKNEKQASLRIAASLDAEMVTEDVIGDSDVVEELTEIEELAEIEETAEIYAGLDSEPDNGADQEPEQKPARVIGFQAPVTDDDARVGAEDGMSGSDGSREENSAGWPEASEIRADEEYPEDYGAEDAEGYEASDGTEGYEASDGTEGYEASDGAGGYGASDGAAEYEAADDTGGYEEADSRDEGPSEYGAGDYEDDGSEEYDAEEYPANPSEDAADKEDMEFGGKGSADFVTEKKQRQAGQPRQSAGEEHDKARIRSLTREEKELYGAFIQNRSARQRLVNAIDSISMAAFTGNVIVTGDEGMDTMTLAKNMVREIQMNDSNFSGKTAKISGDALNKKDVSSILQQLKNGALIVQKASGMNRKTAENLYKGLQNESLGIVVILEDTKKAANKFLAANKELEECFNARMDLEALSNESLVAFGRKYAREREYSFDELGILALHTRIEDMQTSDHAVTVMEVKDIVDEAIRRANKKSMGHFFDILLAKRYDDEDMIILREKDFV